MIEFLINNYTIFLKMIAFIICLCISGMILAVGTIIISHFVYRVIEVLLIFVFFRKNYKWDYKWDYKNYKWDYVDLNFKGYANSVRTTDIKLPPPTPLNNNNKL